MLVLSFIVGVMSIGFIAMCILLCNKLDSLESTVRRLDGFVNNHGRRLDDDESEMDLQGIRLLKLINELGLRISDNELVKKD